MIMKNKYEPVQNSAFLPFFNLDNLVYILQNVPKSSVLILAIVRGNCVSDCLSRL